MKLKLIVMGEAGDGKSTLIKYFYDNTDEADKARISRELFSHNYVPRDIRTGSSPDGVTDRTECYPVKIGEADVLLIDTPGIGGTCGPATTLAKIQAILQDSAHGINGILFVKSMNQRMTLGVRVVSEFVNVLLEGEDRWSSIILVGTKQDAFVYDNDEDIDPTEQIQKIVDTFNESIPNYPNVEGVTHVARVNIKVRNRHPETDVSTLISVLRNWRSERTLQYANPSDEDMADVLRQSKWDVDATAHSYRVARENFHKEAAVAGGVAGLYGGILGLLGSGYLDAGALIVNSAGYLATAPAVSGLAAAAATASGVAVAGVAAYVMYKATGSDKKTLGLLDRVRIEPTGRDAEVIALCAFFSAVAYDVRTREELDDAMRQYILGMDDSEVFYQEEDIKYLNVRPDERDGDESFDCRMLSIIVGNRLYVAWRGTKCVADLCTDIDTKPVSCHYWENKYPHVRVHKGMFGIIQHFVNKLFPDLVGLIERFEVKEVIFTGHSLGAGLAQVALMCLCGQREDRFEGIIGDSEEVNTKLTGVHFCCKAFASPMVFSYKSEDLNETEKRAIREFSEDALIFVYDQDVVPRMPAHMEYWKPALKRMVQDSAKEYFSGGPSGFDPVKQLFGGTAAGVFYQTLLDKLETDSEFDTALRSYNHCATLIHVTEPTSEGTPTSSGIKPSAFIHRTNADLTGIEFNDEDANMDLLASHSVFPQCMGRFMIRKITERLKQEYPSESFDD